MRPTPSSHLERRIYTYPLGFVGQNWCLTWGRGSGVGVDTAYPRCWIRRLGVSWEYGPRLHRYAVSISVMDTAYWSSE
ncbi:hypothetical protein Tco_0291172 [Tanacetum coccineum]